jgi:hemoglobin-like flavoprotein
LTPLQADLLQVTLRELQRAPAFAAGLFYGSLFTRRPHLQAVLGTTFDHEGKRLLWILNAATAGLSEPQRFIGLLTLAGRRAVREGLDRECVNAIGDSIQSMLSHYLGEFYTDDVQEAWQAAYRHVSDVMESGPTEH